MGNASHVSHINYIVLSIVSILLTIQSFWSSRMNLFLYELITSIQCCFITEMLVFSIAYFYTIHIISDLTTTK
jgi:hypothetical protein